MARERWHARVLERSVDVALAAVPVPMRVLDVGCGTGEWLREVIQRVPYGETYMGVDVEQQTVEQQTVEQARRDSDARITFRCAEAEALPFPDAYFDLVASTLSFHHWSDQRRGVEELARVVRDTGTVVLVDMSAGWVRRRKVDVRSPRAVTRLLTAAGLRVKRRESVHRFAFVLPYVRAFIAAP